MPRISHILLEATMVSTFTISFEIIRTLKNFLDGLKDVLNLSQMSSLRFRQLS